MILGRYEKMLDEQEWAGGMKLVEATSQASGESRPRAVAPVQQYHVADDEEATPS